MNSTKMTESCRYLIIGASMAGLTAAFQIRKRDREGSIILLSDESVLPYKRTKLSKNLNKNIEGNPFILFNQNRYTEKVIDLRLKTRAEQILPKDHKVMVNNGTTITYEKLLIATGAKPKELSIEGSQYISHLWTYKDALNIQKSMEKAKRVLVIGTGVEGIELADQFFKAGMDVFLVGRSKQPMERWLDAPMREELISLMEQRGITQRHGTSVYSIKKQKNQFVVLCGKEHFEVDRVVSSTGIRANNFCFNNLSIKGTNGLIVNSYLETPEADIFGAGDVLELAPHFSQGLWHSAQYQAEVAAENMTGGKVKINQRSFRLKTEVFDQFYFSQNYYNNKDSEFKTLYQESESLVKVFQEKGEVKSLLMKNEKTISKPLQTWVQQNLSAEEMLMKIKELKENT